MQSYDLLIGEMYVVFAMLRALQAKQIRIRRDLSITGIGVIRTQVQF